MDIFKKNAKIAFKTEHWHGSSWDSLPSPPRSRTQMHLPSVGIQKQREEERERTGRGFITFSGCPETTVRHHALACVEKTFLTGGGALHFDMPSVSTERASPGFSSKDFSFNWSPSQSQMHLSHVWLRGSHRFKIRASPGFQTASHDPYEAGSPQLRWASIYCSWDACFGRFLLNHRV